MTNHFFKLLFHVEQVRTKKIDNLNIRDLHSSENIEPEKLTLKVSLFKRSDYMHNGYCQKIKLCWLTSMLSPCSLMI